MEACGGSPVMNINEGVLDGATAAQLILQQQQTIAEQQHTITLLLLRQGDLERTREMCHRLSAQVSDLERKLQREDAENETLRMRCLRELSGRLLAEERAAVAQEDLADAEELLRQLSSRVSDLEATAANQRADCSEAVALLVSTTAERDEAEKTVVELRRELARADEQWRRSSAEREQHLRELTAERDAIALALSDERVAAENARLELSLKVSQLAACDASMAAQAQVLLQNESLREQLNAELAALRHRAPSDAAVYVPAADLAEAVTPRQAPDHLAGVGSAPEQSTSSPAARKNTPRWKGCWRGIKNIVRR